MTKLLRSNIRGSTPLDGAMYFDSEFPAPCRHCGGPTWMRDEEGAVHPCCELNLEAGKREGLPGRHVPRPTLRERDNTAPFICPACKASEQLNREQRRRHGQR